MSDTMVPISQQIWDGKYRFRDNYGVPHDKTPDETFYRVAKALAEAEKPEARSVWTTKFYDVMKDFSFVPAGRILAGAGTGRRVTLSNCLAGETLILTLEYGLVPIGEIAGECVHVLDGKGRWIKSPINAFGEQSLRAVNLRGGYNGRVRKTIRATPNHRWVMANDDIVLTDGLKAGDQLVPARRLSPALTDSYIAGVQHGIVYGDGSQRPKGETYLRLCGDKSALLPFFDGWTITYRDDDPHLYLGRDQARAMRMKVLPGTEDADYLTGFLRGWMATDGCVSRGKALISCGADEADWLRQYGAVAGMEVSCVTKLSDESNYGPRNKALFNVHFHAHTMVPEDFLLDKHRNGFEPREYPWVVESLGEVEEAEPVFCPRVTTTNSVTLDLGIHTGQCFTMGTIPDSMNGIFEMLKEAALTMQQGGGIGYDFSTIRPKGALVESVGADASGPLSFMDVWDAMCRTVMSAGSRRGAMMATMRCDHPDIEDFITAKSDARRLRMFNLSVLVTDDFMAAVKNDAEWRLHFENRDGKTLLSKMVKARELWDKIMRSTYDYAEPGVIFIDRVNADHNLNYLETIATTNPCGEKPMGPYASCLLGSINLAKFVENPFTQDCAFDLKGLRDTVRIAIRMMDNVVDVGGFPLPAQREKAQQDRQLGLGVTGLADMLVMMRVKYGTPAALALTDEIMQHITETAYLTSADLAVEKGVFPTFDSESFLASGFMTKMTPKVRDAVQEKGIRNGLLISIAPTGTISLFAGNVSSGIEPIFAYSYTRKVLNPDGTHRQERVEDYAVALYRKHFYESVYSPDTHATSEWSDDLLPDYFVSAQTLTPQDHIVMQAKAQFWVDSSISKTVNVPKDISFENFKAVYDLAYDLGCKGCTTYRPNDVTGSILSVDTPAPAPAKTIKLAMGQDEIVAVVNAYLGNPVNPDRNTRLRIWLNRQGAAKVADLNPDRYQAMMEFLVAQTDDQPQRALTLEDIIDRTRDFFNSARSTTERNERRSWIAAFLRDHEAASVSRLPQALWHDLIECMAMAPDVAELPAMRGLDGLARHEILVGTNDTPIMPDTPETAPAARHEVLEGKTYKLKFGADDHAIYVTINDTMEGDQRRPFEVFINSKNMEHYAWIVALTRMISAIFRRPHDSSFVVEELKNVFDPKGGAFHKGRFVPSVIAAIGGVIEQHMISIGYGPGKTDALKESQAAVLRIKNGLSSRAEELDLPEAVTEFIQFSARQAPPSGPSCPKCHSHNVKNESGCFTCLDCAHSKCG